MKAADKLIQIYEEAQQSLEKAIRRKIGNGGYAAYERQLLRQIQKQLKKLKAQTPELVHQMVLSDYQAGLDSLLEDLKKQGIPLPDLGPFAQLNTQTVELVAKNIVSDFRRASNLVGRHAQDELRKAALAATAQKEATGGTLREMYKDLQERLSSRFGVPYKNGAVMPVDKYCKMVARTTPAEAQNKAKIVQGKALGYDLVRMTHHHPTCAVCAMYQDRVYALTKAAAQGKYKGPNGEKLFFPLLYDTALSHGYETVHPHCRHRFAIFVPQARTPAELAEWSRKSMQPFEDTRADKERKAYADDQADKRRKNDDLKDWQKYKDALGNDAPTFSGFRNMKKADSVQYQAIRDRYNLQSLAQSDIVKEKIRSYPTSLGEKIVYDTAYGKRFLPKGTEITSTRIIAADELSVKFRNAQSRADNYGGDTAKWIKKTGKIETDLYIFDIHWDECIGVGRHEWKISNITEKG